VVVPPYRFPEWSADSLSRWENKFPFETFQKVKVKL